MPAGLTACQLPTPHGVYPTPTPWCTPHPHTVVYYPTPWCVPVVCTRGVYPGGWCTRGVGGVGYGQGGVRYQGRRGGYPGPSRALPSPSTRVPAPHPVLVSVTREVPQWMGVSTRPSTPRAYGMCKPVSCRPESLAASTNVSNLYINVLDGRLCVLEDA